ncbi:MAG TPA: AmmeMemoRadiSam system protein B, partial [Planctomycetia bacterium]|nr:AmmeMemoRadiSam system protein B [Planctomycetia bacterium]
MGNIERPRLCDCDVERGTDQSAPTLILSNRDGLTDSFIQVPEIVGAVLHCFDGSGDASDISARLAEEFGLKIPPSFIADLAGKLDEILVLDTPRLAAARANRLEQFRASRIRRPACAGGVYSDRPDVLRGQLDELFDRPGGAGRPDSGPPKGDLRAVFAPHIDYRRGGASYGWAYRAVAERSDADLFVIVATSHYSAARFILTRNSFATPFGVAPTDVEYVDALASAYASSVDGDCPVVDPFADELAHVPEHSIELEVVMLQHVLSGRRPFSIVPLLVGSFADAIDEGAEPSSIPAVARMIDALREVESRLRKRICYLISGDLAHIGPKFGDPWPVDSEKAAWNLAGDAAFLRALATGRPAEIHAAAASEGDSRRICGYPPAYV